MRSLLIGIYFFTLFSSMAQKIKINAQFEIDSPFVRVNATSLADVEKIFGKDYTLLKPYQNQFCILYKNGFSFEYHPWDKAPLICAYHVQLPLKAGDAAGVELGKTTVHEVREMFEGEYLKVSQRKAMIHTPGMNYTFEPDWNFEDGVNPNAKITGFYAYNGNYIALPNRADDEGLPCKRVDELSKKFLPVTDSLMADIYGKELFKEYFKLAEKDFAIISDKGRILQYNECVAKEYVEKYEIAYYFNIPGSMSDFHHYWKFVLSHRGKILEGGKKLWVFNVEGRKALPLCQQIDVENVKSIVKDRIKEPFSECAVIPYERDYISDGDKFSHIDTNHFFLEINYYHWIKEAKNIGDKYKYTTKNLIIDVCTYKVMKYWEETKQGTRNRPGHF